MKKCSIYGCENVSKNKPSIWFNIWAFLYTSTTDWYVCPDHHDLFDE